MNGAMYWCPVHEVDWRECSDFCLPEREVFRAIRRAFNQYWFQRARGIGKSIGRVRACVHCGRAFVVTWSGQRYCKPTHRKRAWEVTRRKRYTELAA